MVKDTLMSMATQLQIGGIVQYCIILMVYDGTYAKAFRLSFKQILALGLGIDEIVVFVV